MFVWAIILGDRSVLIRFVCVFEGHAEIDFNYGNIELIDLGYLANALTLASLTTLPEPSTVFQYYKLVKNGKRFKRHQ